MNGMAIVCTAALGVLLFGLGLAISMVRFLAKRFYGHEVDPADGLYKLVRAHGNTGEYAAFFAVLFLYLGAHDPPGWVVATMVAATLCRYLLVIGMVAFPTVAKPNPIRFLGASGTYFTGLALCGAVVMTL